MPRAYISAKVENEIEVKQQRDTLWQVTDAHRYYKKVDPHVTIVPPFTVKDGHEEDVQRIVDRLNVKGKTVEVTDIGFYENINDPFVVMLSVSVDLQRERDLLMEELPQHTKRNIIEPVTPHITLFKTQGWWDSIDVETKDKLQYEISNRQPVRDTRLKSATVDLN